jgi:PAS domain S-box-containing protein
MSDIAGVSERHLAEAGRDQVIDELRRSQDWLRADLEAMTRLHELGSLFVRKGNLEPVLLEIVDAAIAISGADFGNIQLLDAKSADLRIVAQRGFSDWWLEFWNSVSRGHGVCGTALERGERVIVEDVESSPIFEGTPALEIQRRAGVRAVQSTPLVSRSGKPLGMFSTHWRNPGRPGERSLRLLDLLARHAADITERAQNEQALRQTEERFRLLVQGAKDCAIYMLAPDGTVSSWTAAGEQIYGYREEEVVGRHRALFFTDEDRRAEVPRRELEEAAALGRCEHEAWRVRKDGSLFWANVLITALRDDAGNVRGFASVHRDFTERRKSEAALRESEERYRSLFEHMSEGLAYCRMLFEGERPVDYVFLEVNPAFEVLTGLKGVVGMKVSEIIPGIHESDPALIERYGKVARLGTPDRFEIYVTALGQWFDISSYSPARGDFVAIFDVITDRKRAEEALREQERRYRWMFEKSLDAVYVTRHTDGTILDANPAACALHGMSVNEIRERGRAGLVVGDDRLAEGMVRRALYGEGRTELNLLRKDGTTFPAEVESIIVGPAESEFTAFVIARDITERKRAEDDLRAADRRKTEFLGVLSHELRNPLAPIRNSIYLLEHAAAGSEQAAHARQVIRRQTEHLSRLIDDLLDVTRISRGKIRLQRGRVDLCDVVRRATDDLHSLFAHAGVDLCVDHVFGPVWIEGDHVRIAQVLGNLLQNAVKFTPSGGTVTVTLVANGARAELGVRDTGVGMEPQAVERMFEPFVQAEMTLARTKGGLGLGLPLVKALVELHGGTVEARSDGPGKGSEFIVRLPLAETGAEVRPEQRVAAEARPREILIIEDNLDAGETLAEVLELEGHRVRVARDGRSGLELAHERHPDVVLCDIGLPDLDGYEVARALRRDEDLRATRLVALSGYAQLEDQKLARDAGFDVHIAKPPDLDELMNVLANAN